MDSPSKKRRISFRIKIRHHLGIIVVVLLGYSAFIEPYNIHITQVDITIPTLPRAFDGYTIAVMSDLHCRRLASKSPLERAVRMANALHPDAIALLGDYNTTGAERADESAAILSRLHASDGVYAILGNHDQLYRTRISQLLTANGNIMLLSNQSKVIQKSGQKLWFAGLDDLDSGQTNISKALHGIPPKQPVILLVHEPIFADVARHYPIALQLSGHTHGGQIRLPFLGAPHYPPNVGRYHAGLYHTGHLTVYVNRGIGTTGPPLRFYSPPEITLIHLRGNARKTRNRY